jgi:4-hydroxy-tetrahydrodipicolinate reductase
MTGLFVVGALGRMGRAVREALEHDGSAGWVGGLDVREQPELGVVAGLQRLPTGVDAVLDFSHPAVLSESLRLAVQARVPLVVGTTGLGAPHEAALAEAARFVPVVASPNLSVGVNVLFHLAGELARLLGPAYDLEIVELHHNRKKDAPSGTALRLYEVLAEAREGSRRVAGRDGAVGAREPSEIGVHAVRAGDVVGEHRLIAAGNDEVIELVHRAGSRQCLARGAVDTALRLVGRAPGRYRVADLL